MSREARAAARARRDTRRAAALLAGHDAVRSARDDRARRDETPADLAHALEGVPSRRTIVFALALIALADGLFLYLRQGSADSLLARKGTLASVETAALDARDGFAYTDVTVRGSTGLVVHARVRAPLEAS